MKRRMNYFVWLKRFVPVKNHIDNNASCDGFAFETYGAEVAYVVDMANTKPEHVWTVIDSGGSDMTIVAGYHYCNRFFYLITEKPWTDEFHEVKY